MNEMHESGLLCICYAGRNKTFMTSLFMKSTILLAHTVGIQHNE